MFGVGYHNTVPTLAVFSVGADLWRSPLVEFLMNMVFGNCRSVVWPTLAATALTLAVPVVYGNPSPETIPGSRTFEFIGMAAPSRDRPVDVARTYTTAQLKVTETPPGGGNPTTQTFNLEYVKLFGVKDKVGSNPNPAGQLFDYRMEPILDPLNQPVIAETPDSNDLLQVDGKLFLITHYEYDWLLSDGSEGRRRPDWYTRMPMGMTLTTLLQDEKGRLVPQDQKPINFSSVGGLWIPCNGSQTPWNTHLAGEEDYDFIHNPENGKDYPITTNAIKAMKNVYFRNTQEVNPYNYGYPTEVRVNGDGSYQVNKRYAMGRGTWELAKVMPDSRTAYYAEDGINGMLSMFVADRPADLSSGTVYAARWEQLTPDSEPGGRANIRWVKLGHASEEEVKSLANSLAYFTDLFDAEDPVNGSCPSEGYTRVRTGSMADECIRLKPLKEKAAAFLDGRRLAALKGATTEWNKMEGITLNARDAKLYLTASYIERGMLKDPTAPVDHIRLPKLMAGITYTLDLTKGQKDSDGNDIASDWVASLIYAEPELMGQDIPVDAKGNSQAEDRIGNPDNLSFSEEMRTLFIGEDSGGHVNNFVWAYNVDTHKLSRILSLTSGAESTGLQIIESLGGQRYLMSNGQHKGDFIHTMNVNPELQAAVTPLIDRFDADVGYIAFNPAP